MAPELRFMFLRTYYHIFGFIPKTYLSSITPIPWYILYIHLARAYACAPVYARVCVCVCVYARVALACSYTHKKGSYSKT